MVEEAEESHRRCLSEKEGNALMDAICNWLGKQGNESEIKAILKRCPSAIWHNYWG